MHYWYRLCLARIFGFLLLATTASAATPALEQQFSKLPLATQLWIKLEAKREIATNNVAKETALKAIGSAGNALNTANLSAETLSQFVMMNVAKDAENDIRNLLEEAERLNNKKKDVRGNSTSALAGKVNETNTSHRSIVVKSAAMDKALAEKHMDYDALRLLNEEQQSRLQLAVQHLSKAEEVYLAHK